MINEKITPIRVSFSRIKTWRRCHKAHWYKYVMGIQRRQSPTGMFKGRIVHDMVEAYLTGKDWKTVLKHYVDQYNRLFPEERELFGDLPNDMRRIMEGYIRRWKNDGLKYISVEEKFEFPLEKGITFVFQLDAIVEDSKKRQWLLERKTPKKFPDEQVRLSDIQTLMYTWALSKVRKKNKLVGVVWDYVRSKAPTIPETLKKGGLSIAQNIDTDHYTYLEAIKANKLDPKEYQEKLQALKSVEDRFYRRVYMPISESARNIVVNDMLSTAREIRANPNSDTRSLDYTCGQCMYFNLCQAELRDLDLEFILKKDYIKTTEDTRYEAEVEIENS